MRKLSFLILLATAAAPALAAGPNDRGRHQDDSASDKSETRSERARPSRSEAREQRSEAREQRTNRPAEVREQRSVAVQRADGNDGQQNVRRVREHNQQQQQAATTESGGQDSVRNRGGRDRQGTSTTNQAQTNWGERERRVRATPGTTSTSTQAQTNWRERERRVRTIPDTTPTATRQSSRERSAFRDRDRNRRDYRNGNYTRWSSSQWHNWRNDRRYDWRHYRDRNRSHFRIGIYFDPFGYNYRRWSVGSFLNSGYYRSSYWLNDPWQYRLPPAYGPYRWVRYWNDALLVNIYTGEVEDVIHGFFW